MKRLTARNLIVGAGAAAALAALAWPRRRAMDLNRAVVLITGGSRGLGLGLARQFAREGARLVLAARDPHELDAAARDLASTGAEVLTVPCDLTQPPQIENLVLSAISRFHRIDVLVNNAGVIHVGPLDAMTMDDFETAMNVMFWGTVRTTLAALPYMRRLPQARIVNITSIGGKVSMPHLLPYSCAKFATVAFSQGLRSELHGTGIDVVTIAPGLLRTGSYLNAHLKGDTNSEAVWFSLGSTLPGVSMDAARAARQIVSAARTGRAERILSLQALLFVRFQALFPEIAAALLGLVNRVLPSGGNQQALRGADSPALKQLWLYALTTAGRRAARRYLQPPTPAPAIPGMQKT